MRRWRGWNAPQSVPNWRSTFAPAPAMVSYLHSAYGIRP